MSKTFKRIALVAVAALGLGVMTTVSSQAADNTNLNCTTANSITDGSACASIAGPANYVTVTATTLSVYVTLTNGLFSDGTSSKTIAASGTANIMTPAAGTITAKGYAITNGVASSTAQTVTITVAAAASGTTLDHSTAYLNTTTGSAATADTTSPTASATASATPRARVTVTQYYSTDTATVVSTSYTKAVVVSISGAGSVSTASNGTVTGVNATVAAAGSTNGVSDFYVYSDGRSGVGTVTITVNGATVATKTITFYGTTSVLKEDTTVSPSKTYIGVGSTGTITWKGYDSLGNLSESAPAALDYAVSSDTTVATVTAVDGVATVTGVKSGSATITICDTASCVSPTLSATAKVTITGTTLGSVSLAWDQSSYDPGQKMVLTISAKDSAGAPLADGSYDLFGTSPTPNVNLTGWTDPSSTSVTIKGGVATVTAYAPLASGTVTVSGTDSLTAANAVSASATVSSSADAAVDAANEATDAANAATDAANAAAEAADAATAAAQDAQAAVAALATQVATLIAGIKAQITTLTNLVVKIQKKVKA